MSQKKSKMLKKYVARLGFEDRGYITRIKVGQVIDHRGKLIERFIEHTHLFIKELKNSYNSASWKEKTDLSIFLKTFKQNETSNQ